MTVPAKQFQRLMRLTTLLVVLVLLMIGVVERAGYDAGANEAREDMAHGFRQLGELAGQANLTPRDREARAAIYLRMADKLDDANSKQVRSSCDRLKP